MVEIESEVLNTKVPRLLIQPLIENSIKHGFKDKDRLEIAIYGFLYENSIYIGVHDSGSGIEKRRLDEIINSFKQKQNMGNNFGLYNLKQRLTLIYGETSEFKDAYLKFEEEARQEGFKEIADFFKELREVEEEHAKRFKELYDKLDKETIFKGTKDSKWVCMNCGYIYEGAEAPQKCPLCGYPKSYFKPYCKIEN